MRVLFVYQFLTTGGVEAVLRNRYLGLKRLNSSVAFDVLFLMSHVPVPRDLGDRIFITGDPKEIERRMREADVVSIIDTPQVFPQAEASRRPCIIEVHTGYVRGRSYLREALPSATRLVLTPSRTFCRVVQGEVDRKFAVEMIYNPVASGFFEARTVASSPRFRSLLWVGRLDELKDWEGALRIARRTLEQMELADLELFMIGRHSSPTAPIERFREHGILGRVRYMAQATWEQMPAIFAGVARAGGIHCSTSRIESFGMTVAESMAAGIPCVLNRLPVFEEITDGGALFFRGDDEAVGQIEKLLKDRSVYLEAGRRLRMVAEKFRPEYIAGQLIQKLEAVA